jgi:hypothetical protein
MSGVARGRNRAGPGAERHLARTVHWRSPDERGEHMRGVITRKEVLIHAVTIARLFGTRAYWRCLCAAFSSAPSTFLEVVFKYEG